MHRLLSASWVLLLLAWAAAATVVLVSDAPSAAHATVQVVAQQFPDRAGRPSVDAAVPFALPAAAGNCSGMLYVTGAFRAVAESGPAAPSAMIFALGVGPAPPLALGPGAPRISWNMSAANAGFAAALAAGGNASSNYTFALSLRYVPLAPLAAGQVYWLSLHASMADGNGTYANRFYWRALDASAAAGMPSSLRDPGNVLQRGWTAWTGLAGVEAALFPADAASAAPRLAVHVEASGCTGEGAGAPAAAPLAVAPAPRGVPPAPRVAPAAAPPSPAVAPPSPVVAAPSVPSVAPPAPVQAPAAPSSAVLAPSAAASPSGNGTLVAPPAGLFSTWMIVTILAASAAVFAALVVFVVLFVRHWRNLRRIRNNQVGAREYLTLQGNKSAFGGVVPIAADSLGVAAPATEEKLVPLTGGVRAPPAVPPLNTAPWLGASGDAYAHVQLDGTHSGTNTPRSAHLIADDDDTSKVGNMHALPRRGSVSNSLAASPRPLASSGRGSRAAQRHDASSSES